MKRAPKTRTQNPTVLLGPAFVWRCPLCSEINFEVFRSLRPGEYKRMCSEQGDDAPEEEGLCRNPGAVECESCGKVFRALVAIDEDEDDDGDMNLVEDAGDWTDGEP